VRRYVILFKVYSFKRKYRS